MHSRETFTYPKPRISHQTSWTLQRRQNVIVLSHANLCNTIRGICFEVIGRAVVCFLNKLTEDFHKWITLRSIHIQLRTGVNVYSSRKLLAVWNSNGIR